MKTSLDRTRLYKSCVRIFLWISLIVTCYGGAGQPFDAKMATAIARDYAISEHFTNVKFVGCISASVFSLDSDCVKYYGDSLGTKIFEWNGLARSWGCAFTVDGLGPDTVLSVVVAQDSALGLYRYQSNYVNKKQYALDQIINIEDSSWYNSTILAGLPREGGLPCWTCLMYAYNQGSYLTASLKRGLVYDNDSAKATMRTAWTFGSRSTTEFTFDAYTRKYIQGGGVEAVNEYVPSDITNVAMHPNPASSSVSLSNIDDHSDVFLYNLQGQELSRWKSCDAKCTIALPELTNGLYMVVCSRQHELVEIPLMIIR